jgi:hypothetical protein
MAGSRFALLGVCALAGVLFGVPDHAFAQSGFSMKGRTAGHCKLSNVSAGRELYNGTCMITETVEGKSVLFSVKMGSAQSFKFATSDGGRTWMHGPEQVKFRDRGHTGIFRWSNFRLEVDED